MMIAIFGGNGMIGQRIILEALVRGHEVKALSRHPENFPITHPRLKVVGAEILDPASVAEALADADVLVNATSGQRNPDLRTFYIDSTNATIEGAKRAGKRLIVVGGAGSLEVAPGVCLMDTPEFLAEWEPTARAQAETLVIFRASEGVNWTFFSPSALIMPGRRTAKYRLGTDQLLFNDQGESYISAEDYAVALLDEIEHSQFIRQRFTAVSLEK